MASERAIAQATPAARALAGIAAEHELVVTHGNGPQVGLLALQARGAELERARRMLVAGAAPEQVLEALARGITNKLLHAPVSALSQAGDAERAELIALFERIYKLPEPPAP